MISNLFIIILVLLLTSTYSTLLDIQSIGTFYCQNGTNPSLYCCPLLAHRMATTYEPTMSIILNNRSGYNITLAGANLEYGLWVKNNILNCEPQTDPLANGQSEAFSSISKDSRYGTARGYATFTMDDKISSSFIISWKIPNTGGYYVYFLSKKRYIIDFQTGFENKVLQITIYRESQIVNASY